MILTMPEGLAYSKILIAAVNRCATQKHDSPVAKPLCCVLAFLRR